MKTRIQEKPAPLPRLVAAKKAAEEIGIPYTSLRDLTFRGLIPVIKLGRAWYYERTDLAELVEKLKERNER